MNEWKLAEQQGPLLILSRVFSYVAEIHADICLVPHKKQIEWQVKIQDISPLQKVHVRPPLQQFCLKNEMKCLPLWWIASFVVLHFCTSNDDSLWQAQFQLALVWEHCWLWRLHPPNSLCALGPVHPPHLMLFHCFPRAIDLLNLCQLIFIQPLCWSECLSLYVVFGLSNSNPLCTVVKSWTKPLESLDWNFVLWPSKVSCV